MSGLVFKGDVIYSTGEYLPAPYINKISVEETEITIENFIFLDDYSDVDLVDSDSNVSNSREEYKNKVLNDLKYYILVLKDYPEMAETPAAEIFEQIVDKTLNPFVFYHGSFDLIASMEDDSEETVLDLSDSREGTESNSDYAKLEEIDTDSVSSKDFYDETGNRVTAYAVQTSFTIEDDDHYYVFCFASTFDYFSDSSQMDEDNFNSTLFDLQIGDVSYEKVYEDGELAIQDSIKFYDGDDNLYERVPLQAIDSSIHKIGDVDHDYIKSNIESLLEEYSTQYNSETGYDKIKNVMNAIYSTLELHYEKYDIVPRLEKIRRSFSDKTPRLPVGKLYKRFSKRLFNINKTLMQYGPLSKKIVYNSKLVDLRSISYEFASKSHDEDTDGSDYLYTSWQGAQVALTPDENQVVVSGYFFFDYEKALRTKSKISEFLNVNRLEALGVSIPYESFSITSIALVPQETATNPMMTSIFSTGSYPLVSTIEYSEDTYITPESDGDFNSLLIGSAYGADSADDITTENGFITSVVNRAYTGIYDSTLNINNYRLMCFEYLQYHGGVLMSQSEEMGASITISDNTSELVSTLSSSAFESLEQIQDYQAKAEIECVFNSDLGRFNQFFLEGALNEYSSAPSTAPWYTAPVIYTFHLDLFCDQYGGDLQKIEDAAKDITSAINPKDGTTEAIDRFVEDFADLLDDIYSEYTAVDAADVEFANSELAIPDPMTIEEVENYDEWVGRHREDDTTGAREWLLNEARSERGSD